MPEASKRRPSSGNRSPKQGAADAAASSPLMEPWCSELEVDVMGSGSAFEERLLSVPLGKSRARRRIPVDPISQSMRGAILLVADGTVLDEVEDTALNQPIWLLDRLDQARDVHPQAGEIQDRLLNLRSLRIF